MDVINNHEKYINTLGNFWETFNNLEMTLRLYLNRKNGGNNQEASVYLNLEHGDICDENPITNHDSFENICKSFNALQEINGKIDFSEIIKLRNAMAHGRILGDEEANMSVIKYSKAADKKVKVDYSRKIINDEMNKIILEMFQFVQKISSQK